MWVCGQHLGPGVQRVPWARGDPLLQEEVTLTRPRWPCWAGWAGGHPGRGSGWEEGAEQALVGIRAAARQRRGSRGPEPPARETAAREVPASPASRAFWPLVLPADWPLFLGGAGLLPSLSSRDQEMAACVCTLVPATQTPGPGPCGGQRGHLPPPQVMPLPMWLRGLWLSLGDQESTG